MLQERVRHIATERVGAWTASSAWANLTNNMPHLKKWKRMPSVTVRAFPFVTSFRSWFSTVDCGEPWGYVGENCYRCGHVKGQKLGSTIQKTVEATVLTAAGVTAVLLLVWPWDWPGSFFGGRGKDLRFGVYTDLSAIGKDLYQWTSQYKRCLFILISTK